MINRDPIAPLLCLDVRGSLTRACLGILKPSGTVGGKGEGSRTNGVVLSERELGSEQMGKRMVVQMYVSRGLD